MLPGVFPDRAFSTRYAIKDLSYALEMADASGLDVAAAKLTMQRLKQADEAGYGDQYHPVVLKVIDPT
jgi:3-hydroxyisobutyrate dehydrogenase